ncbi:MAG TPA: hypothetical protein VHA57_02825 [Actinomycetota bacterium]|nr:hypothetical protein [Actinomycetota bacterium]
MSRETEHLDTATLSALIDEQGAAAARAVAARHLASCAECTARKASLESAVKAVGGLKKVSPTAGETRAMRMAVLEARPHAGIRRRLRWWPAHPLAGTRRRVAATGMAAAVALVAAVWLAVANLGPTASPTAGKVAAPPGRVSSGTAAPAGSAVNGELAPAPAPTSRSGSPAPYAVFGASTSPGNLAVAPAQPVFSSEAQVASYVAGQASVSAAARTATAGDAAARTKGLVATLPAVPGAAPTPTAGTAAPVSSPAAGSQLAPAPGAAAPPPTFAGCVQQVIGAAPQPAEALEATPVSYQGTPAWLIVAATPPAAYSTPISSEPLSREQFWVQSQSACATLVQGTV